MTFIEFLRQNYPSLLESSFNRLQMGGLVSIPVSRFNRDIAELLNDRDRSQDPQLHTSVSAGDTVSPWEASVNQAIAETYKLQDQCRGCQNRNRDFDGYVAPEHVRGLKCAINPTYAMDGVGECADFVADEPVSQQLQTLQTLFNKFKAIPGVVEFKAEKDRTLHSSEWAYMVRVKRDGKKDQVFGFLEYEINNPKLIEQIELFIRGVIKRDHR